METNNKYIDLEYLKQISNGSNEFVYQMITVFIEEIPLELANIDKFLQAKDWKSLRATAHKMKPSYSFMGVKELEVLVNTLEEKCSAETDLELMPGLVERIKSITAEVVKELEVEKTKFA
ncbi:MAG: Hpt protein [Bacteroidota bacterium]|jgi:HPt (histidine-containing phosphotransfer) domain-containing protein|nr:Hpt protein [Bacteroidota bacterium]